MKALLAVLVVLMASNAFSSEIVYRADFEGAHPDEGWSGAEGKIAAGHRGSMALRIRNGDPEKTVLRRTALPADRLAGQYVTIAAVVRAQGVSRPPNRAGGIKLMLVLETAEGTQRRQVQIPHGTFEWIAFENSFRTPGDITGATLVVGLQKSDGAVLYDSVEVLVGRPQRAGKRSEAMFKGHDRPRLRGMALGPNNELQDVIDLAEGWGVNLIRWQLNWTPLDDKQELSRDLRAYDAWLLERLDVFDEVLATCEKYGIKVVLDLHSPPGGRAEDQAQRLFSKRRFQDKLVQVWARIARRYKGRDSIYAYDLVNEPYEGTVAEGLLTWHELATKVARKIREFDPGKPVVVEPGPGGGPGGFDEFAPLNLDRVIYSFHVYEPHGFTYQGVNDRPTGVAYPGVVTGLDWNKDRLREALIPALEFQREFNVPLYIGEFSAVRWAPDDGAYRYLRDLIDLFEEYGWDWTYHAFRRWEGWDAELDTDRENRTRGAEPTNRQELLMNWFSKNERPAD